MAEITKPLYCLLEKGAKQKWANTEQLSFKNLKQLLLTAPVLTIFDHNLPLNLMFYLIFIQTKSERPIAYASRTLNKTELNYSLIDKEGA